MAFPIQCSLTVYPENTAQDSSKATASRPLDLPQNGALTEIGQQSERASDVRPACAEFLAIASEFYEVSACVIPVLAARPLRVRERGTFEPFGDYDPDPGLDADGSSQGSHLVRHVREHAMPRILPPSGFPEVRISRLVAHTRLPPRFTIMRGERR